MFSKEEQKKCGYPKIHNFAYQHLGKSATEIICIKDLAKHYIISLMPVKLLITKHIICVNFLTGIFFSAAILGILENSEPELENLQQIGKCIMTRGSVLRKNEITRMVSKLTVIAIFLKNYFSCEKIKIFTFKGKCPNF